MRAVWWIGERFPAVFRFYLGLLPDIELLMSAQSRRNFFDSRRTSQRPIKGCCEPPNSGGSLPRQWWKVAGKGREAIDTKP
jgi:hypothetical protein